MLLVIFILFAVLVVGVLMYALATHPKVQELGRIMFAFSLLVILLSLKDIVALIH